MKKLLFLVMFLILIVSVMGVKPTQENLNGLQLGFPDYEWGGINTAWEIPVHVYRVSDGLVQNSSVNCSFHIYNSTGHHILEGWDDVPSHGIDYEFVVSSTDIKTKGFYSIHVYCECSGCGADQTDIGGFIRHVFYVSNDGTPKDLEGNGSFLWAVILIPLIFGLFMLIGAATMGDEHSILRVALFLISVPMIWVSLHWALIGIIRFYGFLELENAIGSTTYWMGWFFFVLISYFLIYFVWKAFNAMAQNKDDKMNY